VKPARSVFLLPTVSMLVLGCKKEEEPPPGDSDAGSDGSQVQNDLAGDHSASDLAVRYPDASAIPGRFRRELSAP
jgi:hypothetical protein